MVDFNLFVSRSSKVSYLSPFSVAYVDNRSVNERPPRGTHVDSISYYTYDLAESNKAMYLMQQRKTKIALTGNSSFVADNWLARIMKSAYAVADRIMVDSAEDNALRATYSSFDEHGGGIPQAELMSSRYGSFGPLAEMSPSTPQSSPYAKPLNRFEAPLDQESVVTPSGQPPRRKPGVLTRKAPAEEKLLVSRRSQLISFSSTLTNFVLDSLERRKNNQQTTVMPYLAQQIIEVLFVVLPVVLD